MIQPIFVLILFFHVGPMGDGNSNATTTQEFFGKATCEAAGKAAKELVRGTLKSAEYVCVQK